MEKIIAPRYKFSVYDTEGKVVFRTEEVSLREEAFRIATHLLSIYTIREYTCRLEVREGMYYQSKLTFENLEKLI